ncbi:MAG: AMP-binding protein [Eikenella sp.]|nr:AMP-binding protein [Eikenella sp.]
MKPAPPTGYLKPTRRLTAMPISFLPDTAPDALIADHWPADAFRRATAALAAKLQARQVSAVALWFDDDARFASALLAAWQAGADVYLPPNLAENNRRWAEEHGTLWLTDQAGFPAPHLLYDSAAEQAGTPEGGSGSLRVADGAALYLKTSGSSGEAKVIRKTAAQMQREAQALAACLPQAWQGLRAVGSVSPQHLYGLTFRIFTALAAGWRIGRHACPYPEDLLAAAGEPCIWITSPALLNRLGEGRNWHTLRGRVRGILSAGGALPEATAELLHRQLGFYPTDIYGSTETGVIARRQGSGAWTPLPAVHTGLNAEGALWAESPWSAGRQQTADAARFAEDGLHLAGRCDRIIKFEDKRVSLPQIEHRLLAHEWVADAHCGRHPQHRHLAAWAALSPAGIQALREQGRAAVQQALKQCVAAELDTVAVPRYWRFAAELPRNTQAKIREQDFQAAFATPQTAPEWRLLHSDEAAGEYRFGGRVPLDLVYFGGHFAAFPLVPGVVEVQWAMDLAARFDWGRSAVTHIENLKYQQFVRPHDEIVLQLRRDAAKRKIHFSLHQGERACASGRVALAPETDAQAT